MNNVILNKVESIERCLKRIEEIYNGDIKILESQIITNETKILEK